MTEELQKNIDVKEFTRPLGALGELPEIESAIKDEILSQRDLKGMAQREKAKFIDEIV